MSSETATPGFAGEVIDMWAPVVPTHDTMEWVGKSIPEELLQYVEVFTKVRVTPEQYESIAPGQGLDDEVILAELDRAGIRRTMITGFDELMTCGKTFIPNELVAAIAERNPGRFIPFAGADVMGGGKALAGLEYWVSERGFRGLSLRPFMIKRPASDPAYYPFYAKCAELGIPVSVHTSANWTRTNPNDLGHPRHLEQVACHFPELVLIMSHGGYPWVLEACLAAWKHPNVYLELAAHRPRYFAAPGAGWDSLMRFGQTTIAEKVLYGTGAFLISRPYTELVGEMRSLPLSPAIAERWLWRNAAELLELEASSPAAA